jgi:DNA processing protein
MSSSRDSREAPGACRSCVRRSWLLSALSGPLEYCARDRGRLIAVLELADSQLLQALAGRRSAELAATYERFHAGELQGALDIEATCRHHPGYPPALDGPSSPRMLEVAGGAGRLARLTSGPVVALVGSRAASDYGMEVARSLARSLAVTGVTVTASLTDGIAVAAHRGSLDANRGSVAVMGGGLGVSCSARRRPLYARVTRAGCAVSELPWDCRGRRWGQLASERIVVGLAQLTVLVEAENTTADLAAARTARAIGRTVAAIPGRVTSPLSCGTHALLMDGAELVRGPQDVLELLCSSAHCQPEAPTAPGAQSGVEANAGLEPRLKVILERVGAGWDTPNRLAREGDDYAEVLLGLSELELMGLLARGDGGRYLLRDALQAPALRPHTLGNG